MSLPDDISRCHDEKCQVREQCERWIWRESGGPGTRHAATMRPAWQCFTEPCDHAIGCFEEEDE